MATLDIRLSDGVSIETIPVTDGTPMTQRAQDTTTALNTHSSTGHFRCGWGYGITLAFNDAIEFAANLNGTATNVQAFIPAGNYATGAALATAMTTAMQAAENAFPGGARVTITVTYVEGSGLFNWAWTELRATISQFIIRGTPSPSAGGYGRTILTNVGIQLGGDQVGAGASGNFDTDHDTRVNRFCFGFSGLGGSLRLADSLFTAEAFYGITDTTNQTIGHYLCNIDVLDPPPPELVPGGTSSPSKDLGAPPSASVGVNRAPFLLVIPKYFDPVHAAWWDKEMHQGGPADYAVRGLRKILIERSRAFTEGDSN